MTALSRRSWSCEQDSGLEIHLQKVDDADGKGAFSLWYSGTDNTTVCMTEQHHLALLIEIFDPSQWLAAIAWAIGAIAEGNKSRMTGLALLSFSEMFYAYLWLLLWNVVGAWFLLSKARAKLFLNAYYCTKHPLSLSLSLTYSLSLFSLHSSLCLKLL